MLEGDVPSDVSSQKESRHQSADCHSNYPSFTQEAVEKTRSQIDACEQIEQVDCGSGYQEPNSPIDQKSKKIKKYDKNVSSRQ